MNKRDELKLLISMRKPDIIQVTEILPKQVPSSIDEPDIDYDKEFDIPGYNIFINKNPKRGIAIYFKSSLDITLCETLNNKFQECLWCSTTINSVSVLFGCIYRSPSSDHAESTADLIEMLKHPDILKHNKIVITGDFNYPGIDWSNLCSSSGADSDFIECINDLFLQQLILNPTRHRSGQKSNILDLVLTNDESIVNNIQHLSPIGKSDHDVLLLTLDIASSNKAPKNVKNNFYKTDFNGFTHFLKDIDWNKLNDMDTEQSWKCFKEILHTGFKKFVPKNKTRVKDQPAWLSNKCMKYIKKKYHLFKRFKFSNTHYDFILKPEMKQKRQIRQAVKDYEKKISENCKTNVKGFWKYVNSKLKRSSGISYLTKPDGSLTKDDKEKATVLDSFFCSVFTEEDTINTPTLLPRNKNMFYLISSSHKKQ